MSVSIDYSDPAQYVINISKAYMPVVQTTPTEIRQLNIDTLRASLNDLMDDPAGIPYPTNHSHNPPTTFAGVTLARVVEILDPYVIEFEDGQYNVNVVGGNSNVSDKTIKNQVGVNTANSAGLQDPFSLQAASYMGEVCVDTANGTPGTSFPQGTRSAPVNNLTDAVFLANQRGLPVFRVIGDLHIQTTDFGKGFIFKGDSYVTASVTIDASSDVTDCTFNNLTISGSLDNDNTFSACSVQTIDVFQGRIIDSGLTGPVMLGPSGSVELIECFSEVPGGAPAQLPEIDLGGETAATLIVRGYSGGLKITNCTSEIPSSFDFDSGRCVFSPTVTAGNFYVRGVCEVTDDSTGSAQVFDQTLTAITQKARISAERAGTQRIV